MKPSLNCAPLSPEGLLLYALIAILIKKSADALTLPLVLNSAKIPLLVVSFESLEPEM